MASGVTHDPETGFPVIEAGGEKRLLALTPPKVATMMAIPDYAANNDVIPKTQWKPTNRLLTIGKNIPRYNQGQIGRCEIVSEIGSFSGCRASAGLPPLRFSMAALYALVNGGMDRGAGMGDVYAAVLQKDYGFPLESLLKDGFYGPRQIPASVWAESKKYRPREGYHGKTFADIATAIQRDAWPNVGVVAGAGGFNNLDSKGRIPVKRGQPDHAIMGVDLVDLGGGEWGILCNNSWGLQWGMTGDYAGMCVVSERAYDATTYQDSMIYQGVTIDADADLPPVAA